MARVMRNSKSNGVRYCEGNGRCYGNGEVQIDGT